MSESTVRQMAPFVLSAVAHALVIGIAVAMGTMRLDAPVAVAGEPLAIEAALVDPAQLEPPPPPGPSAEELAAEAARQAEAAQRARQAEAARQEQIKRRAEKTRREIREREAREREARERETKRLAETKAAEERAAAERREAAKRDAERRARESALQQALAAEEGRLAAVRERDRLSSQWAAAIQGRVQRAWIRPASAKPGLDCRVAVGQVPGGTVVRVEVRSCNGDEVVRQSIEAAVWRASPLPAPPDPGLFERELELRFRPNE